jgi:hypothetical protein
MRFFHNIDYARMVLFDIALYLDLPQIILGRIDGLQSRSIDKAPQHGSSSHHQ